MDGISIIVHGTEIKLENFCVSGKHLYIGGFKLNIQEIEAIEHKCYREKCFTVIFNDHPIYFFTDNEEKILQRVSIPQFN